MSSAAAAVSAHLSPRDLNLSVDGRPFAHSTSLILAALPYLHNAGWRVAEQVCNAWRSELHSARHGIACIMCEKKAVPPRRVLMDGCTFCRECHIAGMREFELFRLSRSAVRPASIPNQVHEQLWIGDQDSGRDLAFLREHAIGRVILAGRRLHSCHHPDQLAYLELQIDDSLEENLITHVDDCLRFIAEGAAHGHATLVHCASGISRSGGIVVAFLMHHGRLSFDDALAEAKRVRPRIWPNSNFALQLRRWGERNGLERQQ
jgi:atypical dual specificity phosphatase